MTAAYRHLDRIRSERMIGQQGFPWPLTCLAYRLDSTGPGCRASKTGMASTYVRSRYAFEKGRRS